MKEKKRKENKDYFIFLTNVLSILTNTFLFTELINFCPDEIDPEC